MIPSSQAPDPSPARKNDPSASDRPPISRLNSTITPAAVSKMARMSRACLWNGDLERVRDDRGAGRDLRETEPDDLVLSARVVDRGRLRTSGGGSSVSEPDDHFEVGLDIPPSYHGP